MTPTQQVKELESEISVAEKQIAKHEEIGGERNKEKAERYRALIVDRRAQIAALKKEED